MKRKERPDLMSANILVTGGAGFIGSNFIEYAFGRAGFRGRIVNYDKLTYAGTPANLSGVARAYGPRYKFVRGDVRDYGKALRTIKAYSIDAVVHFAAESHVDRSIFGPKDFIETNVNGTFSMLEAARNAWNGRSDVRFHHISTDEVYGSLGRTGAFSETTPYDPRSPYSASKASSDHVARAYFHTYGLPVSISNCSNNYGPRHYPEKLIPLLILNALEGKPLPVYGDGKNVRDWLYVEDHCSAIWSILLRGEAGRTYNVGGGCELKNIDVVRAVCRILERVRPSASNAALKGGSYMDLITFVKDRPGHDRRYAINSSRIRRELGWKPAHDFEAGLAATVNWYLKNPAWIAAVRKASYSEWLKKNYASRK